MTRFAFLGPILMWVSIPSFVLAGSFEGVVTSKVSSGGEVTQKKTYFKGDKFRMDEDNGDYQVWDMGKNETYNISLSDKTVVRMSMSGMKVDKSLYADTTVTRTGKSDKVAGYACDVYHIKDKLGASDMCVGKGITSAEYYQWMRGLVGEALANLAKDGGLPLREVEYDESGRVVSTEEVTKIEATKLDDSVFAPPPGWKSQDVKQEMQRLSDGAAQLKKELEQAQQKQRSK